MKHTHINTVKSFTLGVAIISLMTLNFYSQAHYGSAIMINKAFDTQDIISLFAVTVDDITTKTPLYINEAKNDVDTIISIPDDQRTFANTVRSLDELLSLSNIAIAQRVYEALEILSPHEDIRNAAHNAYIKICDFWTDHVTSNKKLYSAFIAYAAKNDELEQLSDQQHYFLNNTINSFKREGLYLSDEILEQIKILRKELANLTAEFDRNIAQDNTSISVTHQQLEGMGETFINTLKRTNNDLYILGVDYPTYFRIMENCSVADTRKKLYIAFNNRAYPINEPLLKAIITKRDEIARLLGYVDFAHYDIGDQMAHTPERAQAFIDNLAQKSLLKTKSEMETLTKVLPLSVELTAEGAIQPWDLSYLENSYKKTLFDLDERKISEYFPMKKTIDELLDIYSQFFSINFEEISTHGLWHEDLTIVRVLSKNDNQLLGTLILDLYPRPNKYNHAAHTTIIPSTYMLDGKRIPDVSIVIANFSRPTVTHPSLLKRDEVKTFFHEFGHALHAVLGATYIASLSGTHTKTDFVELPSQMLEEWLTDKNILKKISQHYVTGESLPDKIIDTIISLKNFMTGHFVARQAYLSSIALTYFGPSENKDPQAIMHQLYTTMMPYMAYSTDNRFYTSFGHLTGYAAKYYGYLWSKVFALDLFSTIKQHGLLNPEIGKKYVEEILSKGGAQDPNELLYNFLGREPNSQAFFDAMGLNL